ncbi:hypothetical protein VIGAN_05047600 [Vigna angularis var. angularis]|uniref:X8 domain-containing protein n=1 Tax=Vigna angularis var. angularis TaxID=157739 RepID=A0A0S3S2U0_PHAAN|nr:hypothetical protein VIGAN_05047600 [Vigna angularis var. angularis]
MNTASYAFNDYFRKHEIAEENCNFGNNAAITSLNPSQFSLHPLNPFYPSLLQFQIPSKKFLIFFYFNFSGFGNCKFPSSSIVNNGNLSGSASSTDRCPVKTQVGAVELFGGGGFGHLLSPLIYSP